MSLDFIPAVNQLRNLAKTRRFSSDEILTSQYDPHSSGNKGFRIPE